MRASGVLLPVSSLPSKYGIGSFSKEAFEFVDQLKRGGQKYWQILPLGPTGYGDSPYQSFSTFAGNPFYIDLEALIQEGLLTEQECDSVDFTGHPSYVEYEKIYRGKFGVLRQAFGRYVPDKDYEDFVKENAFWLEDYLMKYAQTTGPKVLAGKIVLEARNRYLSRELDDLTAVVIKVE